jgi:hypothetical protein
MRVDLKVEERDFPAIYWQKPRVFFPDKDELSHPASRDPVLVVTIHLEDSEREAIKNMQPEIIWENPTLPHRHSQELPGRIQFENSEQYEKEKEERSWRKYMIYHTRYLTTFEGEEVDLFRGMKLGMVNEKAEEFKKALAAFKAKLDKLSQPVNRTETFEL